ncbi:hypothetical protein DH2020_035600 [Rehmannia glutinosa]|uniref:Mitochondrial inner membrane protease ATP23 n=1 Tax=Rehmannia glutinosa TaxID=99300 RepID=A0ABR0V659_REHGL
MADSADSKPTFGAGGGGMTVEECQNMIQRTPMVKFLKENLEKSGCGIGSNFIKAIHCKGATAGGYVRGEGIVVCSNHLQIQDEVTQVVIHELIHAYDECRAANLDWSDCAHHACSEIRAGHLSGDCHYKREFLRGFMKIRGHEQFTCACKLHPFLSNLMPKLCLSDLMLKECVRRRVMKSVTANPYCSEAAAKDAMEAVWDTCYNDTKPFDRAP